MDIKRVLIRNFESVLFPESFVFPSTRFQGSKAKILNWIWENIEDLDFHTALDAFGGTGSVSYMFKDKGKCVVYNDILKFNWYVGVALIQNDSVTLDEKDVEFLTARHPGIEYPTFVQDTFKDIYFTDKENKWIDMVTANIEEMDNFYKKSVAYFALFQSCLVKRPFNLFHRKNLYLRISDVQRNFGNKVTWDTPFEVHFRRFVNEANSAVFSNGQKNEAVNQDVFNLNEDFDLVYIDTPYTSANGIAVDYRGFYHFLEGLVNYDRWHELIDYHTKHKRLRTLQSPWIDRNRIQDAFDNLFRKFKNSILVVSYRSDGIPSIEDLRKLLLQYKHEVNISRMEYKYVLSNNHSEEVLFVAR